MKQMEEQTIQQLQEEVAQLKKMADQMMTMLRDIQTYQWHDNDHWMSIDDLCAYIPSHPARQTLYGWLCQYNIPAYRVPGMQKNLMFLQSEIDEWLLKNRVQTKKILSE